MTVAGGRLHENGFANSRAILLRNELLDTYRSLLRPVRLMPPKWCPWVALCIRCYDVWMGIDDRSAHACPGDCTK